jgi:hypothetical protein
MSTINPTTQSVGDNYPLVEASIDDDHTQDTDATTGIANPNAVAYATPVAGNTSENGGGSISTVRELQFAEAGATALARVQGPAYVEENELRAARQISNLKDEINASGKSHNVNPEVIGAILFQELATKGSDDLKQDEYARAIAATKPGTPERQAAIDRANSDFFNVSGPNPLKPKDITRQTTLGDSQISTQGMVELFGGKWNDKTKQYEQIPGGKNYLPNVMDQRTFFQDPVGNSMKILTDSKLAPTVVGAWSEKQVAERSDRVRDSGTQYPNFSQSANRDLHYVFLTGTYSTGGQFVRLNGANWSGFDRARTEDPLKYSNLSRNEGPSPGATAALERRERINNLLNGAPLDSQYQPRYTPYPRPMPAPMGS